MNHREVSFHSRFLALFLSFCLLLPDSAFALRSLQPGQDPTTVQKIQAGLEEKNTVDIFGDFEKVEGLGADSPIVLIVKGKDNATYRMQRFLELEKAKKEGFPYGYSARRRPQTAEGFVAAGPLRQVVVEDRPVWRQVGLEPYALATQDSQDLAVIGFGRQLHLIRISDGKLLKVITHPKFFYLHTVEFSKDNPDVVLIASYGADRILEFNLKTEQVLWEWNPWKLEPYSKNAFGIQIIEKGEPLPSGEGVYVLTREEAAARIQRRQAPLEGELPVYVVDFEREEHPLGLEPWELTVRPNWATYSDTPGKILATSYFTGQAVEIDKEKEETRVLVDGLENPHGVVPVQDGYLVSDTGNGRVLSLNKQFQLMKVYDFSSLPLRPGLETRTLNWVQHTYPLGESLLATVDSQRSTVVVWDPKTRRYSLYPYPTEWTVQEVRALTSQRLLALASAAPRAYGPQGPEAGLEEKGQTPEESVPGTRGTSGEAVVVERYRGLFPVGSAEPAPNRIAAYLNVERGRHETLRIFVPSADLPDRVRILVQKGLPTPPGVKAVEFSRDLTRAEGDFLIARLGPGTLAIVDPEIVKQAPDEWDKLFVDYRLVGIPIDSATLRGLAPDQLAALLVALNALEEVGLRQEVVGLRIQRERDGLSVSLYV